MKKDKIIIILLGLLILSNIISWTILISEINDVERVYFEERRICFRGLIDNYEETCEEICLERDYDGSSGSGSEGDECVCSCYKLVK